MTWILNSEFSVTAIIRPQRGDLDLIEGGMMTRAVVSVAVLVLLVLSSRGPAEDPTEAPADDRMFPLPPQEVAAGKFDEWARATKQPSSIIYTRVEYDRKRYWVVEAGFGYGDPSEKIAVYAPTQDGSFRRCLLAGPMKVGRLVIAVDAETGILSLTEEIRNDTKGEVVLTCNLKVVDVSP